MSEEISTSLHGSIQFVPTEDLALALEDSPLPADQADALVDAYEDGQITALRIGLLVAAAIVAAALFVARRVPDAPFDQLAREAEERERAVP